ncbi:MAG: glycosyltransferase [Bacteroidales bacterium]|nr:glycosyltransferase [Bacteroidales bacterium]
MDTIKNVIILTDSFPFGHSEPFLESEIISWKDYPSLAVTLLPILNASGNKRPIPENWSVDSQLVSKLKWYEKTILFTFPIVFLNPFFWKELAKYPKIIFKPKKIRRLIAVSTFSYVISKYLLKNYMKILAAPGTLIYSYWFYYSAYGAALLKRKGYPFKLISRAHRMDIYQNRKETHYYIPFRKFPVWNYINQIYPVSKEGRDYLMSNQSIPNHKLEVSYLGVAEQTHITAFSEIKTINLLSCSNLAPVKRINLLIDNISIFGAKYKTIEIKWTHIGDGPLKETLTKHAKEKLKSNNIDHIFLGNIDNTKVLDYYQQNTIDCFVTTSASEGLPVSIMEALSFGVPVLSTNVGGISEAVNDKVGYLLDYDFTYEDFEKGILYILKFKDKAKRKQIADWGNTFFGAITNYKNFIENALIPEYI